MEEQLLSVRELSEFLQLDEQTIYRKIDQGSIPHMRLGATIRFSKKKIEEWMERLVVDTKPSVDRRK